LIVAPTANELEVFEHDRKATALLAGILVFPGIEPKTALDKQGTTFGAILGNDFALATPRLNINECRFFTLLPSAVLKRAINRQTELTDGRTFRRDPEFGVASKVTDEKDAIEISHGVGRPESRDGD
jgi:hypothetical protein